MGNSDHEIQGHSAIYYNHFILCKMITLECMQSLSLSFSNKWNSDMCSCNMLKFIQHLQLRKIYLSVKDIKLIAIKQC